MARYLSDNCYCNGSLTANNIIATQSIIAPSIDIHTLDIDVVSSQSVLADDVTVDDKVVTKDLEATGNISCSGTITSLNSNCTNASALTLETSAIALADETVNTWQDLITNGYINIPTPTAASTITEGSNVLYDDLNNSTNKIISSNPLFYGYEPYHYCKQTTWPSSLHSDYQLPVIEIQHPVTDSYDFAYYNIKVNDYRMIPVKEDTSYNIHDNTLYEDIEDHHGKFYKYIHSDSSTAINIDNSDGDFIGTLRLYNTSDQTITYDLVVRTHSIYVNDEELAMPFNLTNVACYGYYKKVDYVYYPIELIVVSTSSDAGEYWNIAVIKNGDIVYTRTLTTADQTNNINWFETCYPCVFHFGNNDNTLMIVCHGNNSVNGKNYITHYTVNYTLGNDAPLNTYTSFDISSDDAWIGSYMRLKQYFTTNGYVVLASDWNFDSYNGENNMTYEHYNGTYGLVEVINPYSTSAQSPLRWFTHTDVQTYTNHNYIVKGIIRFQFSADTSITGNNTENHILVYKCDDQNYAVWQWQLDYNHAITLTEHSLPIYNNSARFNLIYNPELPHTLINRLHLAYINWNCRSPYIIYSTASPPSNPHNQYDSRTYYICYYQLFNINHQTDSASYIIPPYLTNNVALVSDGKIYNNI